MTKYQSRMIFGVLLLTHVPKSATFLCQCAGEGFCPFWSLNRTVAWQPGHLALVPWRSLRSPSPQGFLCEPPLLTHTHKSQTAVDSSCQQSWQLIPRTRSRSLGSPTHITFRWQRADGIASAQWRYLLQATTPTRVCLTTSNLDKLTQSQRRSSQSEILTSHIFTKPRSTTRL